MIKATLLLCVITAVTFFMDTLSYSLRLIVFRNRRYNLTNSAYNLISLVAKTIIVFQMPLLGLLLDVRIAGGIDPKWDFQWILLGGSAGVLIAIILLPWFIPTFERFVGILEKPSWKAASFLWKPIKTAKKIRKFRTSIQISRKEFLQIWRLKWLLLVHAGVTAIFAVGLISSYYAAYLLPSQRLTMAGFSGVINGGATIVMTLLLEPYLSRVTDQVLNGEEEYESLKALVIVLMLSKFLGSVLAQGLFTPAAHFIIQIFKLLVY